MLRLNIKPLLTNLHKEQCAAWCHCFILHTGYYDGLYQFVHIDEKWFVLMEDGNKYYLTSDEEKPTTQVNTLPR